MVRWSAVLDSAIVQGSMGPPLAARAFAITHTCMFDAWAAYDSVAIGTRFGSRLRRPAHERTAVNKAKAISYAAYRALVDLFPAQRPASFDPFMASLGYDPSDASTDPTTPSGVGNLACAAVLGLRHLDGSNQLEGYVDDSGYAPVNPPSAIPVDPATVVDPDRWQPLIYTNSQGVSVTEAFLAPHWGKVTPFAMRSGDQYRSYIGTFGPALHGTAGYEAQSRDLLTLSAGLDDRSKMAAEYWSNGPNDLGAVMHWGYFAAHISARDTNTLDQDVKLFFALGNAELDTSIALWDAKRYFDSVRPVTSIPYLFAGQQVLAWAGPGKGTQSIDGGSWIPYLAPWFHATPFAEFGSGHSAFSAAAARILRLFTGSDTFGASVTLPAGSSAIEPGLTPTRDVVLTWPTFTDAANEDGMSRRYGGLHFEAGDLVGRAVGPIIADQVWLQVLSYVDPTGGVKKRTTEPPAMRQNSSRKKQE